MSDSLEQPWWYDEPQPETQTTGTERVKELERQLEKKGANDYSEMQRLSDGWKASETKLAIAIDMLGRWTALPCFGDCTPIPQSELAALLGKLRGGGVESV